MAEERGLLGKVWDYMKDRVFPEVGDMIDHKVAQGAAEISQALYSQSNAYVPYGTGQQPLEVEGPLQSYQDLLREASQQVMPEPERGLER